MKKSLIILSLLLVTSVRLFAQDEGDDDNNGAPEKIRDKMNEYIQKRLDLSKDEADKFTPIFLKYFKEWRQTLRDSKDLPVLDRQQKIIDLRLRYRMQFRDIVGEKRGDLVYTHQDAFIKILRDLRQERLKSAGRVPVRKNRVNKLL